jgi:hypothetical protein
MSEYKNTRLYTHNGVNITEVEAFKFSGGRALSDGVRVYVKTEAGGRKPFKTLAQAIRWIDYGDES